MTGAVVRLDAEGVITGHVTDADGEPLPEANILVVSEIWVNGSRLFQQVKHTKADDRGGIPPVFLGAGPYYLSAGPREGSGFVCSGTIRANRSSGSTRSTIQAPPNSRWLLRWNSHQGSNSQASTSDCGRSPLITYGARWPVRESGLRTSWSLRNLNGDIRQNFREPAVKGAFDIGGIAPGSYWMEVLPTTPLSPAGKVRIDVTDQDIEGIRILAEVPFEQKASVRFADGAAAAHGLPRLELAPEELSWNRSEHSFSVGHTGAYTIAGMRAGRYTVKTQPPVTEVYVKSVTYSGRPAEGNQIDLSHGPLENLEIVLATDTGTVQGTTDDPQLTSVVLVSPEGPTGNTGARVVRVDENGRFEFHAASPGHWLAFPGNIANEGRWQNREYVQQMADRGVAVVVEPGKTATIEVKP